MEEIYLSKDKTDENIPISLKDIIKYAIVNDFIDILKFLVVNKINISKYLNNALCIATSMNNYLITNYLLKIGGDPSYNDSESLRQSIYFGNLEMVKSLIKAGANVNTYKNEAIRIAIAFDFPDIIEVLIQNGVSYTTYKKENTCINISNNNMIRDVLIDNSNNKKTIFNKIRNTMRSIIKSDNHLDS